MIEFMRRVHALGLYATRRQGERTELGYRAYSIAAWENNGYGAARLAALWRRGWQGFPRS